MKKLKRIFMTVKEVRENLTENLSNLAGDQEEIIVTRNGAPLSKILPIFKEEREKIKAEMHLAESEKS